MVSVPVCQVPQIICHIRIHNFMSVDIFLDIYIRDQPANRTL